MREVKEKQPMETLLILIFLGLLAGGILLVFSGCGRMSGKVTDGNAEKKEVTGLYGEPLDFEELEICTSGMTAGKTVYHIQKTESGVCLEAYLSSFAWDENKGESVECRIPIRKIEGDMELLDTLQRLAGGCEIEKWDGFAGSNPHVLDGNSFSCFVRLADKSTIRAHGTNKFPSNYSSFCRELSNLMLYAWVDSTRVSGQYFNLTVPESWVNQVRIYYAVDYCSFQFPVDTEIALLLRVDYSEIGYTKGKAEQNIPVCRLVSEDKERFITFHLFDSLGVLRQKLTEEQLAIYDSLETELAGIIESLEAAEGYQKVTEVK